MKSKILVLLFFVGKFIFIFGSNETSLIVEKRVKRWGNYGNWNGGGYGQPPYAPPPNNNVAIGYPTAYGLGIGSRGAPEGTSNPSPRFVVRCINGGAHIGQCRLDEDAICIALGGTCVNSQCCTTPFYGHLTTSTTTLQPLIVDGDAFRPRMHSSEESKSDEEKEVEEAEAQPPAEEDEKFKEIDELSKLLEFGKRNGLSTDSPIYAVFAGLFGVTLPPPSPEWQKETAPEENVMEHLQTSTEKHLVFTATVSPITFQPSTTTTKPQITVTFYPPVNSVENSSSEEDPDSDDYTKRRCDDGSRPIGPCNDDLSCPLDHSCQRGSICCFNFAAAKFFMPH